MKLIKATQNGIVTCIDSIIYEITDTVAIEVSDEVASELDLKFGHLVSIMDKPEEIVETKEVSQETKENIVEVKPKKGRTKKT